VIELLTAIVVFSRIAGHFDEYGRVGDRILVDSRDATLTANDGDVRKGGEVSGLDADLEVRGRDATLTEQLVAEEAGDGSGKVRMCGSATSHRVDLAFAI